MELDSVRGLKRDLIARGLTRRALAQGLPAPARDAASARPSWTRVPTSPSASRTRMASSSSRCDLSPPRRRSGPDWTRSEPAHEARYRSDSSAVWSSSAVSIDGDHFRSAARSDTPGVARGLSAASSPMEGRRWSSRTTTSLPMKTTPNREIPSCSRAWPMAVASREIRWHASPPSCRSHRCPAGTGSMPRWRASNPEFALRPVPCPASAGEATAAR